MWGFMRAIILFCLLTGCATFDHHPKWRQALMGYDMAVTSCDSAQTVAFSDDGRWNLGQHNVAIEEANPLLGKNPPVPLILSSLVLALAGEGVAAYSKSHAGDAVLVAAGLIETTVVVSNSRYAGVCGSSTSTLYQVMPNAARN